MAKKLNLKIPESVTEEQLEVWRKKYGKLIIVNIEDEDKEVFSAVFKRPDKDILSAMTRKAKQDEISAIFFVYDNCVLAQDDDLKKDDLLKLQASKKLGESMEKFKGLRQNY